MRLLALAATNSWQGRIADAFLYETASNFQISQSKNVP